MEAGKSAAAAPTGCYKCGRPGHWSRDCPDSNSNPSSNPNPNPNPNPTNLTNSNPSRSSFPSSSSQFNLGNRNPKPAAEKPKKVPRTRPKLTPELLLGDDGLAYVLKHFPRNFKYRGRGHEVGDLGNLLRLYSEWHRQLLPYYSFDQFVFKAEKVAATARLKRCIRGLRERVASGGDPAKLHESASEQVGLDAELDLSNPVEATDSGGLHQQGDPSSNSHDHDGDAIQEDILRDIYDKATEELPQNSHAETELPNHNDKASTSSDALLSEEQRARMEANRLKALEKAAARVRALQSA